MYSLVFVGIAAFALAIFATPVVRNLACVCGALDLPDRKRKLHSLAIPRVGGIAIALAYLGSFALLKAVPLRGGHLVTESLPFTMRLLPAALFILGIGIADDLFGLKPWHKLAGQIASAMLAFWAGIHVQAFVGHHFGHWLSLPLTVVWLLACTNSFNLIDGLDGLASGIGLCATGTMLIAALSQHNVPLALATVPLGGALLGFLRYNFNPATIFLGDSGSLFVGFLLGCYGVVWSEKSATILGMVAPLMALSIPLLDTALAIARRFLRQKPIFGADRGHIHHRLLDRGFTQRKVVLLLYGCCAVGALCSLTMAQGNFSGPIVILFFCLITWIGIGHLRYIEFEVGGRMFVEGAFRRLLNCNIALHGFETELGAAETPDHCWSVIHRAANDFGFHHLEMLLAGRRYSSGGPPSDRFWNIRVPLSDCDYVELTRPFDAPVQTAVAPFADVLRKTLEPKIRDFAGSDTISAPMNTPAEMELTHRL